LCQDSAAVFSLLALRREWEIFWMSRMSPKVAKRQGIFSCSDEELASPAKLVKFAETAPAFMKTGDEDKDEDLKMKRSQFQKSMNLLWRNPDLCFKNVMWLEEKINAKNSKCPQDMFKALSTIGAMDETWCCSWIVANSNIRLETMEAACLVDPESWKQILTFVLKCHMSCKLPPDCRRKAVCGSCFDSRVLQCGGRLSGFMDETLCDEDGGLIDWRTWGCYEPMFVADEPNLRTIRHRPTGHLGHIPAHVTITRAFKLWWNYDDMQARFILKPSEFCAKDLFEAKAGPFFQKTWEGNDKGFQALATLHSDRQADLQQQLSVNDVPETPQKFNSKAKAEKKSNAMLVAREAYQVQQAELNKQRVISFE